MNDLISFIISKLSNPWVIIGFLGQILFFGRFVVQWIASEKQKKSVIPEAFWYFSLGGGILLLIYAISIKDLVFSLGSCLNLIIYARNIILIKKHDAISKSLHKNN
ncbi:MAG: lipid-A-disaccharide synthase N-terminal domain-containing protein [Bacteriovoracaceae bacterium]